MDAIILTAGKGTRLHPLTKHLPKPLFPIAGQPLLVKILDSLNKSINKAIIVIGYEKDQVKEKITEKSYPFEIIWVTQPEQKGTGQAVQLCQEYITSDFFFMMYGDIFVSKEVIQKIINYNLREKKNCGVIAAKEVKDPEKYGCLEISNDELVHIWEKKPNPPSNYINAGLMILPKSIFRHLEATKKSERGEVELTDGINESIRENTTYFVFKIEDYWIDTGYPWDLLSANLIGLNNLLPNDEFSTPAGVTIEGQVRIASSAILRPGTFIQGPVMIEENCVVGPNCYIRSGTYLGNGVRIGNGVEIKNSIILEKTTIGHLSYVGDSIISKNCNFGAGTKIANLKLDDQNILMEINNKRIDSNRRKLGIVMGENVKTGINVSIMPGISIGENSRIGAHTLVTKNLPPNSLLFYHPEEGRVVLKENLYG